MRLCLGDTVLIAEKVMTNIFYHLFDEFTFVYLEAHLVFIKDLAYKFNIYQRQL